MIICFSFNEHLIVIGQQTSKQRKKSYNLVTVWCLFDDHLLINKQTNIVFHLVIICLSFDDNVMIIWNKQTNKQLHDSYHLLINRWSSDDNLLIIWKLTNKQAKLIWWSSDDHYMIIFYLTSNKQTKLFTQWSSVDYLMII